MERLMNVAEAADFLRINPQQLYVSVRQGEIPHMRLRNKTIRFDRTALLRWLKKGKREHTRGKLC